MTSAALIINSPVKNYDFNKNLYIYSLFGWKCCLKLALYLKFLAVLQYIVAVSHPFFSCALLHSGRCIQEDCGCRSHLFFKWNNLLLRSKGYQNTTEIWSSITWALCGHWRSGPSAPDGDLLVLVVLRLNVPVNNFSVMSGRSHRFLGN